MNELLTPEERAQEVKRLVSQLQAEGRTDLLLHAIGVPLLEELRIEAAKGRLSRLVITKDICYSCLILKGLSSSGWQIIGLSCCVIIWRRERCWIRRR